MHSAGHARSGSPDRKSEELNLAYLTTSHHHLGDTAAALETGRQWAADWWRCGEQATWRWSRWIMARWLRRIDERRRCCSATLATSTLPSSRRCGQRRRKTSKGAKSHFDSVVQAQPDNARGWLGLGLAHLYEERTDAAIEALTTATQLMPRHAATLTTLGLGALRQPRLERRRADLPRRDRTRPRIRRSAWRVGASRWSS